MCVRKFPRVDGVGSGSKTARFKERRHASFTKDLGGAAEHAPRSQTQVGGETESELGDTERARPSCLTRRHGCARCRGLTGKARPAARGRPAVLSLGLATHGAAAHGWARDTPGP